jgi:hypothetical protein
LCPCCFYKLEGEHPLAFEWLTTIDGNNSLKRWSSSIYGTSPHNDSCTYHSNYWLSRAQADEFQKGAQTQLVSLAHINYMKLIILARKNVMMIGKMSYSRSLHQHHSIVSTAGEMLVQNNVNACSRSLMNLESLSQPAATRSFF